MVKEYHCSECGKTFSQKGHFTNHQNRKIPCKKITNKVIEEKVQEKLYELSQNGDIDIKNINLISKNDNNTQFSTMDIQNEEGLKYLSKINDNSIDLVLTDPPYITSTETGMGNLHKQIQENKEKGITFVKSIDEWDKVKDKYVNKKGMTEEIMKNNFMKYGSIYGSKYSVQTQYGDWDTSFTMKN